jgi:molybdenum cofactor biosynthesis enzyme MoaA
LRVEMCSPMHLPVCSSCICYRVQCKDNFSTCLPVSASMQVRSSLYLYIIAVVYVVWVHSQFNACTELREAVYMQSMVAVID